MPEVGRYQFHSWTRKGISTGITEGDDLGTGTSSLKERAKIVVPVSLNHGPDIPIDFALIGPGDIIGLNRNMIVRTEPLNWITNFEPNYLAFAELYDEDMAWRYTPAGPDGKKLRPWIFLLVLKEDEYTRTKRGVPLPSITINNKDAFPLATETWLWAHVHSNAELPNDPVTDYDAFLRSLNNTFNSDPDQLYCRLMSPRKLEPNTAYRAFIVPSFETGRLAGIGETEETIKNINTQLSSWDENGARGEMPVYFEWYFHTGADEDFEKLVKLLIPRIMDPKVGIRDMNCSLPGFVKADGTIPFPGTRPGILGLEGALKAPTTVSTKFPDPETEKDFQLELNKVVNLPVTIIGKDDSGDPIISVPLYGGKHAKKSATDLPTLDIEKNTWLHDLNKDPRTRSAAGMGVKVIGENQENYIRRAWDQVQKIIDANRRIKTTMLYMKVALQFTQKTFSKFSGNVLMSVSRPVLPRIMGSPTTVYAQIQESRLPAAVFSGAFRKLIRSKIVKRLEKQRSFNYDTLVNRLNDGSLTAAPLKGIPAGIPTVKDFADKISSTIFPGWLQWLIKNRLLVMIILLLLFGILAVVSGAYIIFAVLAAAAIGSYFYVGRFNVGNMAAAGDLLDPQKELESIAAVPQQPNFTLRLSDETSTPPPTAAAAGQDSVEARNFRKALTDMTQRLAVPSPEKEWAALNIDNAQTKVREGIRPGKTFPYRLSSLVKFPGNIKIEDPEKIFPAMAWPDFEDPMYKKLVALSDQFLLPNLQLIPANTISLLKTNQKFIESYMVGLNHEMGKELLWREYPTDERGSFFRQFWDVNGIIKPAEDKTPAQLSEENKDIKPIHTWLLSSMLGSHNNRDAQGDAEQLVLVIRGDLLNKYPNTLIFAQKAVAGSTAALPEIHRELTDAEFKTEVMFPLYKAEVAPDIKLFGFDLTIEQARGTQTTDPFTDNLGWFFMIQQVPGEPQFGMDINFDQGSDGLSWDDLSWDQFADEMKFIQAGVQPPMDPETIKWGTDAASMAYILFQKPNLVAVYAREMLKDL
jgi:hypothetical protein